MASKTSNRDLLRLTSKGLFCEKGDFYIDPMRPVPFALITHAHADHARWGHQRYLSTARTSALMKARLGTDARYEEISFGVPQQIGEVEVSFHPAGHVLGSAQIKLTDGKETWVVTGDYKMQNDRVATPYEIVPCDVLITECTFGLPVYQWKDQQEIMSEIDAWWAENVARGENSVVFAYSLGKAQRILANLEQLHGPVFCHGAVEKINQVHEDCGVELPKRAMLDSNQKKKQLEGGLIIAPPSTQNTTWLRRFRPLKTAMASGWMTLRGARRRRGSERGFILSDHLDWQELNRVIDLSGARRILFTHGYTSQCAQWFAEKGYDTAELGMEYETDADD